MVRALHGALRYTRKNRWRFLLWGAVGFVELVAVWWGARVQNAKPWVKLGAAPLVGIEEERGWDLRLSLKTVPAALLMLAVIIWVPMVARRARWWLVVTTTGVVAGMLSLALAFTDGERGVLDPVIHPTEYWSVIRDLPPAGTFVRTYVDKLAYYPVHYRGHPPGFMLILKVLASVGFSGPWPVALLSLGATALVPVLVLSTVHRVVGDQQFARRCAPFLVAAPYTIWAMTSADIVFAALGALSVWLVIVTLDSLRWWPLYSFLTGVSFALFAHSSYGAVMFSLTLALVALPAARQRFSWRSIGLRLLPLIFGGLLVTSVFARVGFWWYEGAVATRDWYWKGTAQFRTWTYFVVANTAVVFIAAGPAFVQGIGSLRGRARWIVGGAALSITAATDRRSVV